MMYNAFISYSHEADYQKSIALQKGLMRYALPWYKPSKLNIFRDEDDLSVSPQLWDNIQKSLLASEYLIFMASTRSKDSKWVGKELSFWLSQKSIEKIIIVVTEGDLNWDEENHVYLETDNNCIPEVLNNAFEQEPFYIDLRALKEKDDLTLKNSIFNKEVLKIAAELYGKSQKEMAGEEVKTQTRFKRLTAGVILSLTIAFAIALFFYNDARKAKDAAVIAKGEAEKGKKQIDTLLLVSLQGRGDRYKDLLNGSVDSVIKTLNAERLQPLESLVTTRSIKASIVSVNKNNFDYMIWIDVPSFRTDSIKSVKYEWSKPEQEKIMARPTMISNEASTGFAVAYRGFESKHQNPYINITIYLKGKGPIEIKGWPFKDYIENDRTTLGN